MSLVQSQRALRSYTQHSVAGIEVMKATNWLNLDKLLQLVHCRTIHGVGQYEETPGTLIYTFLNFMASTACHHSSVGAGVG